MVLPAVHSMWGIRRITFKRGIRSKNGLLRWIPSMFLGHLPRECLVRIPSISRRHTVSRVRRFTPLG